MKPFPFNLVIAGVGGQGVATLAKVFWLLASRSDLHCQGSMVKGGAQRLGVPSYAQKMPMNVCSSVRSVGVVIPSPPSRFTSL